MPAAKDDLLGFCPMCFASSDHGSWGETVDINFCANCGSSGSVVMLPRWAIDSIRQQASWVGKRYYCHEEDKQIHEELHALRALVTVFPGRVAEQSPDGGKDWAVTQMKPDGGSCTMYTEARSGEEAMELMKLKLPYYPAEKLEKKASPT